MAMSYAACMPGFIASAAAKSPTVEVNAIAPYVYPGNAEERPAKMVFMPDGETYLQLTDNGRKIQKYSTADGKPVETVFDATHTRESSVESVENFSISPDGSKLLLYTGSEAVYRRSFRAAYYVFEIKRNILRPLSGNHKLQQAPLFSPDSRMVAFVADNDIYVQKLNDNSEVRVTAL